MISLHSMLYLQATPDYVRSVLANWPWFVIAALVVWPVIHFLYSQRIEALKEDVDRLRSRVEDMMASGASTPSLATLAQITEAASGPRPEGSSPVLHAETEQHSQVPVPSGSAPKPDQSKPEMATGIATWDYPSFFELPSSPNLSQRTFLGEHAIKEITAAFKSLPPLQREGGIIAAYGGRWIRGSGTIKRIAKSLQSYMVLLVNDEGFYITLSYPEGYREVLEAFRENQRVQFEGQIRAADHTSIELVYPTIAPTSK